MRLAMCTGVLTGRFSARCTYTRTTIYIPVQNIHTTRTTKRCSPLSTKNATGSIPGVRHFSQTRPRRDKEERETTGLTDEMTRGKLLTTPSRLFKLVIPLTTAARRRDIEPIAILMHPQQPLSFLERVIQSEIPPLDTQEEDRRRAPNISFIAQEHDDSAVRPKNSVYETDTKNTELHKAEAGDCHGLSNYGVSRRNTDARASENAPTYSYSYLWRREPGEDGREQRFVRWSQSTEIGDFIRDASRVREFIVAIEGAGAAGRVRQIRVAVPSFDERTYFLRMRLRKISGRIQGIAEVKHECDTVAQRGAQRVAIGGFGVLATWWCFVYRITFETDLGWDTMEPVTYLASLSTLMGGYLWFLYHNREISYRSALDFTISKRQKKLYQMKGVDLQLWEWLVDEGNALRREIKNIAAEYDVDWNERHDEQNEQVTQALRKERHQKKNGHSHRSNKDKDDDDDND